MPFAVSGRGSDAIRRRRAQARGDGSTDRRLVTRSGRYGGAACRALLGAPGATTWQPCYSRYGKRLKAFITDAVPAGARGSGTPGCCHSGDEAVRGPRDLRAGTWASAGPQFAKSWVIQTVP